VEHHNRLVTKEELIDQVWGGANVSDGVLVASSAEIRKALGEDPKDPRVIKTFPKMGYGLMAPVENVEGSGNAAPESLLDRPMAAPAKSRRRILLTIAAAAALVLIAAGVWWELRAQRAERALYYREAAWWKLDEVRSGKTHDSGFSEIAGTVSGNARVAPGKLGNAMWFDGLQAAVTGRSNLLPSGNSPRTITAWFKAALPQVDDSPLFEYGSRASDLTPERLTLYLKIDGRLQFGAGGSLAGVRRLADDTWHFAAVTYDGPPGNTARIYVDGQIDAEHRLMVEPATQRAGFWKIGSFMVSNSSFRGGIDDVRVYARALKPAVINGIYRCSSGIVDLDQYYYLPVFLPDTVLDARGPQDISTPLWHQGTDISGIQLARPKNDCSLAYLEGADVGQDLHIAVDLLVPLSSDGRPTLAGPYFRSRLAAPGDGLIGGTSAGYWVQLQSDGMVKIKRMNPQSIVAFSDAMPSFDAAAFHHLELEARGESLQVWMDGEPVSFDQGGSRVTTVNVPSAWNGPPAVGVNQGAAGVAFATLPDDRSRAGGQRALNLSVRRLDAK
jgi:hypothetical protein